jgi:hypothetical protein
MSSLLNTEIFHTEYGPFEVSQPTSLDHLGHLCIDLTVEPDWHDGKCTVDLTRTHVAIDIATQEEMAQDI